MRERKRIRENKNKIEKNQHNKTERVLRKKKISPVIIVAVLCVVVYACVNIVSAMMELNKKLDEQEEKEYFLAQITAENESLKNTIKTGDFDEYIIKIAREKLDLVFPEDKVYKIIE